MQSSDADSPIQGVIESIDSAVEYRVQLSQLIDNLNESKSQVELSASRAREKLKSHFVQLKQYVTEALDERLKELELQVQHVEQAALKPLIDCETEINKRVQTAAAVLQEGRLLLESEDKEAGSQYDQMREFKKKSKQLDLNSLPEVPCLWETACVNVDLPRDEENTQRQLVEAIREYGKVIDRPPVQICDIAERPGGVAVKWSECTVDSSIIVEAIKEYGKVIDRPPVQICDIAERPGGVAVKWSEVTQKDGHTLDLNRFRLEYCVGVVRGYGPDLDDIEFIKGYEGPELGATIRGLRPNTRYSVRVCGSVEGAEAWSPWSVPIACMTNLNRYEWRPKTSGYLYDKDYTVVLRDPDMSQSGASVVQYTRCDSCARGGSARVSVVGVGDQGVDTGVGLSVTDTSTDNVLCKGMLYVSSLGVVYVDGQEKTTKLPALQLNSVVTFDTELLNNNRVRVTVEISDKVVTFDWTLDTDDSSQAANGSAALPGMGVKSDQEKGLFVFSRISSPGWRLCID